MVTHYEKVEAKRQTIQTIEQNLQSHREDLAALTQQQWMTQKSMAPNVTPLAKDSQPRSLFESDDEISDDDGTCAGPISRPAQQPSVLNPSDYEGAIPTSTLPMKTPELPFRPTAPKPTMLTSKIPSNDQSPSTINSRFGHVRSNLDNSPAGQPSKLNSIDHEGPQATHTSTTPSRNAGTMVPTNNLSSNNFNRRTKVDINIHVTPHGDEHTVSYRLLLDPYGNNVSAAASEFCRFRYEREFKANLWVMPGESDAVIERGIPIFRVDMQLLVPQPALQG